MADTKTKSTKKPTTAAKPQIAKKSAVVTKRATAAKSAPQKKAAPKKTAKKQEPSANALLSLDLDDEFGLKLFFQPVYDPSKEVIYGYETLLRIVDPDLGTITPGKFMAVAKKNASLLRQLEEWTVAELFRAQRMFRDNRKQVRMLSANIDVLSLQRKDFYEYVSRFFDKIVENIYFEVKEDAFFDDDPNVLRTIDKLRLAGIKIAVDDFTSNFLTFDWGDEVPFDMVKIDRAYIDRILTSPKAQLIVNKIIDFAKRYSLEIVAVGVENKEQEQKLLNMGIEKLQGYYYAKPLKIKMLIDARINADIIESEGDSDAIAHNDKTESVQVIDDTMATGVQGEQSATNNDETVVTESDNADNADKSAAATVTAGEAEDESE